MAPEIDLRDSPQPDDAARGRQADAPAGIPARGWKDVLARTVAEAKRDQVTLLAAGVAFFGLLALVPGLVALVSIYGLVADPSDVASHVGDLLGAAPAELQDLVRNQLAAVTERSSASTGLGAVFGVLVAFWSASSAMKHLIDALNAAYDEEEGRGFLKVRAVSLLLTVGAMAFMLVAFVVVAVLPAALAGSALGDAARIAVGVLRWPALALTFGAGLAVLYRYAPSRDEPEWRWVTPGATLATLVWLAGSGLFSLYVSRFGTYDETYGSLGGVVVSMLWLFLTALVIVLGAELDAELERQTRRDTTQGRDLPMGQRGAHAADTVGPTADEVKTERRQAKANANR
jgi:membrane protein